MKQTAVEWLIEQFKILSDNLLDNGLFDKAKEMEREQIEAAFNEGEIYGERLGEDYYTQTYGETKWQINPKKDQAETKVKPANL